MTLRPDPPSVTYPAPRPRFFFNIPSAPFVARRRLQHRSLIAAHGLFPFHFEDPVDTALPPEAITLESVLATDTELAPSTKRRGDGVNLSRKAFLFNLLR